jgi:hypothetical protein
VPWVREVLGAWSALTGAPTHAKAWPKPPNVGCLVAELKARHYFVHTSQIEMPSGTTLYDAGLIAREAIVSSSIAS